MVSTYGVTRLDFDIEGSVLSDTAATALRDQALAALQAQDPSVQVDFTLAVSPAGLPTGTGSEYALLQDAKSKGVKVSVVNLMTMDFGDGQNALHDAESAAKGADSQLASLYGISGSAAYAMMGLTPIAGQNDDNEVFSTANAAPGRRDRHRLPGPVPGRPLGQHRRLQPGSGLHLQRVQVWKHQSNGELLNPASGKCLDDTGYGGSGTQGQIWSCSDTSNQQWTVS